MIHEPNAVAPISVKYVGICKELCPRDYNEESVDGNFYIMGTLPTEYCDTLARLIPESFYILVAVRGSLSAAVERGFIGFSPL